MGSPLGHHLADVFLGKLETFQLSDQIDKRRYYGRYVYDSFVIATAETDVETLLDAANLAHPSIKFTLEIETADLGQADALTGLISNKQEPEKDTAIAAISIEDDLRRQLSDAIRGIPVNSADIRRATEQDPVLHRSITYVQTC
nr:unnamed protein product [Spirometra erinaceieuropaei]